MATGADGLGIGARPPCEEDARFLRGPGTCVANAPPAAIANALCDAMAARRIQFNETPLSPVRIGAAIDSNRKS